MIELVFIIVILGILGAIAVPKMAASREDAQIVAIKQDVATLIQAIPAMAMSQGAENITSLKSAAAINLANWTVHTGTDEAPMVLMANYKHRNFTTPTNMSNACLYVALLSKEVAGDSSIDSVVASVTNGKSNAKVLRVRNGNAEKCKALGEINVNHDYPLIGKSVVF